MVRFDICFKLLCMHVQTFCVHVCMWYMHVCMWYMHVCMCVYVCACY